MSIPLAPQATLAAALWPTRGHAALLRAALLALGGSLLLTFSAKLQIPFWPVPMTMQTFAVLVIGMGLGARLGGATVALYLAEGSLGLPVFAGTPEKGIGFAYLIGPTGGYLLGFLVSAALLGWLAERGWDRHIGSTLAAMALGSALIFACGLAWLGPLIGFTKAVQFGLLPFLPGAALKIALAAVLLPGIWRMLGRRRNR